MNKLKIAIRIKFQPIFDFQKLIMIQRIQSLLLLLASVGFWGLFKLPFAESDKSVSPFFEDNLLNINDHTALLVLTILGGVLTVVSIFLFKNRNLQLRVGYLNMIFAFFLALVAGWLIFSNGPIIEQSQSVEIADKAGIFLPIFSLIMVIIANYFIKKDENLVQSMDRLR